MNNGANTMLNFDDWWEKDGEWGEPPNRRRGGFSGVLRMTVDNEVIYIKKMEKPSQPYPASPLWYPDNYMSGWPGRKNVVLFRGSLILNSLFKMPAHYTLR